MTAISKVFLNLPEEFPGTEPPVQLTQIGFC